MQLDFQSRELTIKLVYYGPALSGKTTNLQAIHRLIESDASGRLMTLETRDDRTLFFDLLPIAIESANGMSIRIKLFTVPGQVMHNATRRLVLKSADGVVFVADSQRAETQANQKAFINMKENLKENGIDPADIPKVIQYNKRDLPDTWTSQELLKIAERSQEPVIEATATHGVGVVETLSKLFIRVWSDLDERHSIEDRLGMTGADALAQLHACFDTPNDEAPHG
jgi:hypothetical protein